MKLLDDIIELAVDNSGLIGNLLRKCLVLEQQAKNEKFKVWLNQELDGYDNPDELPEYRRFNYVNRGVLISIARVLNSQPLSLHVMSEQDRKLVDEVKLHQSAPSYEGRPDDQNDSQLPWPPTLTVKYQDKFMQGHILNRAWQEIPGSILTGLLETVRNRVLRFALDLKDNLKDEEESVSQLPPETIERSVVANIYGGNIVIASHAANFSQIASTNIAEGDAAGLIAALDKLGVTADGIKQLQSDMQADRQNGKLTVGEKTKKWLENIGTYLGKEGLKAGVEIAKRTATKWVMQHYGFDVG
jgi:hypothetical protein